MSDKYSKLGQEIAAQVVKIKKEMPEVGESFWDLVAAGNAEGALSKITKELIAIAIAIAVRCDDCIASHMRSFIQSGGTRQQLLETIAVAIYMGGGPSVMYGTHALAAFEEFSAR